MFRLTEQNDFYNTDVNVCCLYRPILYHLKLGSSILLRIDERDSQEIRSRVEKLLSNPDVSDLVTRHNQQKNNLDTNKKRLEFFDSIDSLWKSVFLEGKSLVKKKGCNQCPLETI